jgi:hypothetical protein
MEQPTAESALRELGRFVGEWTMTGTPPWPGEARVRFEWLDGAFLVEHWRLRDTAGLPEGMPTSGSSVYGCDAANGTYVRLYSDDRGVCRVYEMDLRGAEWTLRRAGVPFAQRFEGSFSADGGSISGRWEAKEPGGAWRTDFEVTYTRVA